MKPMQSLPVLATALLLSGCQPSQGPTPTVLEVLDGRAVQWHTVLSAQAWAASRSPTSVPNDSLTFVGVSKAYGPGWRHDIYYVAIPGPSETVGRMLCEAIAVVTDVREVPGYAPNERVVVTETWNPDTCGWGIEGLRGDAVYALSGDGKTVNTWVPTAERPADMDVIPDWTGSGGASMTVCSEPTIPLAGALEEGHPAAVCDLTALFGDAGFERTDVPFWSEE